MSRAGLGLEESWLESCRRAGNKEDRCWFVLAVTEWLTTG